MSVLIETNNVRHLVRPDWKTTGWQGLTFQTPAAWNLVAFSGEGASGSLRLDNGEPQGAAVGMEVRWSQIKGRMTDSELEKRLDRYFAGIRKAARRGQIAVDAKSKSVTDDHFPERDLTRTFSWRADRRGVGRIWHCTECGRLVIAQVIGSQGALSALSADVLRSLECHSSEINWQTWSLYDLLTEVPADYALHGKPQLMNIYVQLAFARAQTTDTLSIEQWGVANVQLRGAYLDEWFRTKNAAQEATLRYEELEITAHGHTALLLIGRRRGLTYWTSQVLPQMARLQKPATYYAACLWECPDSNKIHLVQCSSRAPQRDLVKQIVERTPCH